MDAYVRAVRQLEPLEGFDQSFLPGGVEVVHEAEYRASGIPVGPQHRERLAHLAQELGIALPW
jgi:LDH2 family malate/lactate/ureidoglycolate dehydrogenase